MTEETRAALLKVTGESGYIPSGIPATWWAEFRRELRALGIAHLSQHGWKVAIRLRQSERPPSPKTAAALVAAGPK